MEVYNKKNNCYGCGACLNICPVKAITVKEDGEGFLYPYVNSELCIHCNQCKEVCPINQDMAGIIKETQRVFAVKYKEEGVRIISTSGGMFTAISDAVLNHGGSVYGAAFDDELKVCHKRAISAKERDEMRGSKYVQSDIGRTFQLVRMDLSQGKQVLFTGTPCQVAGLKRFMGSADTSNLILCDIICHGVPCHRIWGEYKNLVEKKKRATLKLHYFRTKLNGWHSMTSKNVFHNGKEDYKSLLSQLHMNLFLSNLILRPCCYHCSFATMQRCSDLTIGDFWGVERSLPDFDDNKGISLVLTNTRKGYELLLSLNNKLEIEESTKADCLQNNLLQPTGLPAEREAFWKDYTQYGYRYTAIKYAGYTFKNRMLHIIYYAVKRLHGLIAPKIRWAGKKLKE